MKTKNEDMEFYSINDHMKLIVKPYAPSWIKNQRVSQSVKFPKNDIRLISAAIFLSFISGALFTWFICR